MVVSKRPVFPRLSLLGYVLKLYRLRPISGYALDYIGYVLYLIMP